MFKKTALVLCLMSNGVWATGNPGAEPKIYTETELIQLKNDWLQIYQKELQYAEQLRSKQRENFTQVSQLINSVVAQKQVSPASEQIIQRLMMTLSGYPLEIDADWAWLNAKIALKQLKEGEIQAFLLKYPNSTYQRQLQQLPFEQLYQQQKFEELVEYAKGVKPASLADQCRLFSARYHLYATYAYVNPDVSKVPENKPNDAELKALLQDFDAFWLASPKLTSDCANLESFWRDQGFKTAEKVRLKAVKLAEQNANAEITDLALNSSDESLKTWLNEVAKVVEMPQQLQNFIENQPLESAFKVENKQLALTLFPKYLRTLVENTPSPSFERYQNWAVNYQLSEAEINAWKVSFLSRFFDNSEPTFQLWRDEQIKSLKADNLTERRLRMAIWQKSDLQEWLDVLSEEGKAKAEWRYWTAKIHKNKEVREGIWQALSTERGFYPMLAAQQLGKPYELPAIATPELTEAQHHTYKPQLERIAELRQLGRINEAKNVWIAFLKELSQETKLAVISYAKAQNWYDLAVEGTIQAKAFDYIDLRLPNAYSDWFDLNLKDKKISKSFAQAIARQESAWNPQAKSHANAMGLMQMLPTTAQKTAKDNGLPFKSEGDLLKPFNNIMLGTTHLAELNDKYPNNRILIAAAYNAGAGRVDQWLKRSNQQLAMDEFIASIPFFETRGYVQNVLAYDYYYQTLYGQGNQAKNALKMFYQEELAQKY